MIAVRKHNAILTQCSVYSLFHLHFASLYTDHLWYVTEYFRIGCVSEFSLKFPFSISHAQQHIMVCHPSAFCPNPPICGCIVYTCSSFFCQAEAEAEAKASYLLPPKQISITKEANKSGQGRVFVMNYTRKSIQEKVSGMRERARE